MVTEPEDELLIALHQGIGQDAKGSEVEAPKSNTDGHSNISFSHKMAVTGRRDCTTQAYMAIPEYCADFAAEKPFTQRTCRVGLQRYARMIAACDF